MSEDYDDVLKSLAQIEGFAAAAVMHRRSGMALQSCGEWSALRLEFAVAAMAQVTELGRRIASQGEAEELVEEAVVMTTHHYHVVRPVALEHDHLVYLVVARGEANLGMVLIQIGDAGELAPLA